MGSAVLRFAARVRPEPAIEVSQPARIRAEHWIVAFWLLLGVAGLYQLAGNHQSSVPLVAVDGGIAPPKAH